MTTTLKIDFVSDIACPWCAVGLNSLERALERLGPEFPVTLRFQPFELNPALGPEGEDTVEHLSAKYGIDAAQIARNQAAIHARGAEVNPLHADPASARFGGFETPILHGLCTYGTACRTILREVCKYDHTRIRGLDVRFSSPVYPGETILTDIWVDGPVVSFRCRLKERDVTVINNGRCTLAA